MTASDNRRRGAFALLVRSQRIIQKAPPKRGFGVPGGIAAREIIWVS